MRTRPGRRPTGPFRRSRSVPFRRRGLSGLSATSPLNSGEQERHRDVPVGQARARAGRRPQHLRRPGAARRPAPQRRASPTSPSNALEDENGNSTNWSVTSYAVCAAPVQGLTRVSASSGLDSTSNRVVHADLPGGTAAHGRRWRHQHLQRPDRARRGVPRPRRHRQRLRRLRGRHRQPSQLEPHLLRRSARTACSGVVGTSPKDTSVRKDLHVVCPGGLRLTGAGADLNGGYGLVYLERMLLEDASKPNDLFLNAFVGPLDSAAESLVPTRLRHLCDAPARPRESRGVCRTSRRSRASR